MEVENQPLAPIKNAKQSNKKKKGSKGGGARRASGAQATQKAPSAEVAEQRESQGDAQLDDLFGDNEEAGPSAPAISPDAGAPEVNRKGKKSSRSTKADRAPVAGTDAYMNVDPADPLPPAPSSSTTTSNKKKKKQQEVPAAEALEAQAQAGPDDTSLQVPAPAAPVKSDQPLSKKKSFAEAVTGAGKSSPAPATAGSLDARKNKRPPGSAIPQVAKLAGGGTPAGSSAVSTPTAGEKKPAAGAGAGAAAAAALLNKGTPAAGSAKKAVAAPKSLLESTYATLFAANAGTPTSAKVRIFLLFFPSDARGYSTVLTGW